MQSIKPTIQEHKKVTSLASFFLPRTSKELGLLVFFIVFMLAGAILYHLVAADHVYELIIPFKYNGLLLHKRNKAQFLNLLRTHCKSKGFLKIFPNSLHLTKENIFHFLKWEVKGGLKDRKLIKGKNFTEIHLKVKYKDRQFLEKIMPKYAKEIEDNFSIWFNKRYKLRKSSIQSFYRDSYSKYTFQLQKMLAPLIEKGLKDSILIDSLIRRQNDHENIARSFYHFYRIQRQLDVISGLPAEKIELVKGPYKIHILGKSTINLTIIFISILGFAFLLQGFWSYVSDKYNKT